MTEGIYKIRQKERKFMISAISCATQNVSSNTQSKCATKAASLNTSPDFFQKSVSFQSKKLEDSLGFKIISLFAKLADAVDPRKGMTPEEIAEFEARAAKSQRERESNWMGHNR